MCPSWESHQVHRIPAAAEGVVVLPWQLGLIEGRLWGEEREKGRRWRVRRTKERRDRQADLVSMG